MSDAKAGPDAVGLRPGDPDYVFPKEVHNLLVAANATNITLSGMADTKASILMGASFVVFSHLDRRHRRGARRALPMLVLTMFSFVATVFGVLTVRPNRMRPRPPIPADKINILFFGSYTNAPREDYVDEVIKVLSSEEETYRRLAARPVRPWPACCATTSSAGSTGASPCSWSACSPPRSR